jgi:palmitoyl transferase
MQHATWTVCFAAILASFSHHAAAQSDWDVVLNGRAVHMNATGDWNEDNWGLGLEREFTSPTSRWVKIALANGFSDSMGNPSYMAGGGLKRRFRFGSEDFYVDLGGVAFLMTRENVNGDRPFPGVLPAATIGFKRVALNLTYMPESIADRVTNSKKYDPTMEGVFFLQFKLDASLFGFGRGRQPFLAQSSGD